MPGSASVYVRPTNRDGARTPLDQDLIAEGRENAASVSGKTQFGLWLQATERAARHARAGLSGACAHPSRIAEQRRETARV